MREWEYSDYLDAMESLGEIPMVDEGFKWAFLKPAESDDFAASRKELFDLGAN